MTHSAICGPCTPFAEHSGILESVKMGCLAMWLVPAEKNWMSLMFGMSFADWGSQKRVAR